MDVSISGILTAAAAAAGGLLLLRIMLSLKAVILLLGRCWRSFDEWAQSYQTYEIPQHADDGRQNPLHRKAAVYVASLPSVEDSDMAQIFSTGRKPNDFVLHPAPAQPVSDLYRGARLHWTHHSGSIRLRVRRQDRHRVLRPYLQHVESVADDLDARKREVKLFTHHSSGWRPVPFTHPATMEAVAMDPEVKSRVKADLESFLKGRSYYARMGRVWKRSYLLHGPPGTGKTMFAAAMAKFISYDVYDLDLSKAAGSDPKSLLLQTAPRSVILVEDIDRYKEGVSAMMSFMDGVMSCCGEERVMVFTMSGEKGAVDPAVLRPGRVDVHVHFPMCDFAAFKAMAGSYLGLKEGHKLYPQVEEGFGMGGGRLSPAEVGEIMIANRGSPSRALKAVISALNQSPAVERRRAMSDGGAEVGGGGLGFGKDATVREFKKLYGLIRRSGSKKDGTLSVEMAAAAAAAAAAGHGSNNGSEKDGL